MPEHRRPEALSMAAALVGRHDPVSSAADLRQAMRDAYWVHHDLAAVTVLALAGLAKCLSTAETVNAQTGYQLRSEAKAMLYDLASFTWPGWGEPEIEILDRDTRLGLEAATMNLRLADELDRGDLATSRALWMHAAQLMAAHRYTEAEAQFTEAAAVAERAKAAAEAALAEAFASLSSILAGNVAAEADYARALQRLLAQEEGEALAKQVVTARRVFA